jgi:hypothetical protein
MSICLSVGAVIVSIAAQQFTLSWTHSVERIIWQEDWRVMDQTLSLVEARVRGSGAGMEVHEGAVLKEGVWHYFASRDVPALNLTISPFGRDEYQVCLPVSGCEAIPNILNRFDLKPTEPSYVVKVAPCEIERRHPLKKN